MAICEGTAHPTRLAVGKPYVSVMTEDQRRGILLQLDDELLEGGIILSEWCSIIIREADFAFAKGLIKLLSSVKCRESKHICALSRS